MPLVIACPARESQAGGAEAVSAGAAAAWVTVTERLSNRARSPLARSAGRPARTASTPG